MTIATPYSKEFCSGRLKAIADPTRWTVIAQLLDGPKNVGELNSVLKIDLTLLSHHLKILRNENFVLCIREGKNVRYSLAPGLALPPPQRGIDLGCCHLELNDNRTGTAGDCRDCVNVFETESLCPVCLRRLPATRETRGSDVFLVKRCPEHGEFSTIIWRSGPEFRGWKKKSGGNRTGESQTPAVRGCPFDCGICPTHRKNACTAVLEVTSRCNLRCPVCFADSGGAGRDLDLAEIEECYRRVLRAYGPDIILQLSGGEPTVRDDLPAIIEMGRSLGFSFIQVNTNGLRIAEDESYAAALGKAGAASVFLQFDGTEDAIYETLRGRPLYAVKRRAIERCGENGIGVVLVPTIVPGVNTHNIGAIIRLALELSPVARGVHFQPVGYFGRCPDTPENANRLTLPDVMRLIEEQTDGLMRVEDFSPPGWENSLCSFHGTFLPKPGGGLQALTGHGAGGCCSSEGGDAHAVTFTARQWSAPPATTEEDRNRGDSAGGGTGFETLDGFLERVRTRMLSVSCMAFQDAWNLDLERTKDCCIHVVAPGGKMIPFCLYNLTSSDGTPLYRNAPAMGEEMSYRWSTPSSGTGTGSLRSPPVDSGCRAPAPTASDEPCACAPLEISHRSGCPVCGKRILDLRPPKMLSCRYCGKTMLVEHCCEDEHFVCDQCRILAAADIIKATCLKTSEKDVLAILRDIRSNPRFPTHGPHHHPMTPGILLAAYRNSGGEISDEQIMAGIDRGARIPGAFCSFYGVDGAAIGVGIAFSVILGASPFDGTKRNMVQKIVIRVASKIAEHAAARCCQREVWIALKEAEEISKELLPATIMARYPLQCDQFGKTDYCSGMACPLRRSMVA